MRITIVATLLLLSALAPLSALGQSDPYRLEASTDVAQELEESSSMESDHGQFNCVKEASVGGTEVCDKTTTLAQFPSTGVRLLDSYAASYGFFKVDRYLDPEFIGPPNTAIALQDGLYHDVNRGDSVSRRAGLAPVILPGAAKFHAWYGFWNDGNSDGVIRASMTSPTSSGPKWSGGPGNEWITMGATSEGVVGAALASFVEPGSHPSATSYARPHKSQPDFTYKLLGGTPYWQSGSGQDVVLFTEGSLLQRVTVITANDIILIPGDDPRLPFSATASTLVDVDVYSAAAPYPIDEIYSVAAPVSNLVASPSLGLCPNRCQPGPAPVGGTPLEYPAGAAQGAVFERYEHEIDPGTRNSATGRGQDFKEEARAWLDLLPRTAFSASRGQTSSMSQLGSPSGGMAPGFVGFEVRSGLWRDYNFDDYVGVVADDPYEGGSRPQPNQYDESAGEFSPVGLSATNGAHLIASDRIVTVSPVDRWPEPGVFVFASPDLLGAACKANPSPENCVGEPKPLVYTGTETIELALHTPATPGTTGIYTTINSIFLPTGTLRGGFVACTGPFGLQYNAADGIRLETVWDCDEVSDL